MKSLRRAPFQTGLCCLVLILSLWPISSARAAGEPVDIWVSLAQAPQTQLPGNPPVWNSQTTNFAADSNPDLSTVVVDESQQFQPIEGFGAALTDAATLVISNTQQREPLLKALFSPTDGIGISYVRISIGASDFSRFHYTYDDLQPGQTADPDLKNFSVSHDNDNTIPILKRAKELNSNLRIMATPWSAPAWMKTSNSLYGGKLKPEYYDNYANYFVKFIQAYAAQGLPIDSITIQNEPYHESNSFPSMYMEPSQQAEFIKNHLGPALKRAHLDISTKIIIFDHNWGDNDHPENSVLYETYTRHVLDDPDAYPYITGSAFHCYGGEPRVQSRVHEVYPEKAIYFTECTATTDYSNYGQNLDFDMRQLYIRSVRHWAQTVIKWNMALNTAHGPQTGSECLAKRDDNPDKGKPSCTGVVNIDQQSDLVTFSSGAPRLGRLTRAVSPGC